jgi:phosphatidylserine/phosphatidylglycerophosphate/cardiolipin synthase-like enzyme
VFVQSAAVSAAPVLDSLVRAKKRGVDVKVLLGAKPALNIVSGKVLMGNRPYELTAGKELAAFSAADIPVLINPRFNESAGDQIQEGVKCHASYLSLDGATALVCIGRRSTEAFKTPNNTCVLLPDHEDADALAALFLSEFNEDWSHNTDASIRLRSLAHNGSPTTVWRSRAMLVCSSRVMRRWMSGRSLRTLGRVQASRLGRTLSVSWCRDCQAAGPRNARGMVRQWTELSSRINGLRK